MAFLSSDLAFDTVTEIKVTDGMALSILNLGEPFSYSIPSFTAISPTLRQVKIQEESGKLFDAFIQADSSLPSGTSDSPFCIQLTKHCYVPVSIYTRSCT